VHEASLSAAAFTNFGSDHLDYHKTKESYLKAKLILFDEILERGRQAIVFGDQPEVRDSVAKLSGNIITFGMGKENFVRAKDVKCFPGKVLFDLAVDGYMIPNVEIGIFGEFQVLNVLCSVALSYACGLSVTRIVEALSGLSGLNGRMEMIAPYKGGAIYIDYAHTALGFQSALEAFRAGCQAKLICVFGCGGNRDRSKRGEMGRTACAIADAVIVTDDNPRDEDPAFIRSEILADCDERAIEIGDRNEAIRHAMTLIGEGDIIAIIGKGHEVGQIYGNAVIPQNDKDEILKIIANEIKSTVLHV
jgi:UDP-N-acetylmuramoyl-L-alanyl-D-glutamate--2,6-diaminopimelate ligase